MEHTRPGAEWVRNPERGNMLVLRIMTWISLRLGRRVARVLLHGIVFYFLLFAPASRRASRDYLARVLPHPVRWRDSYRHFLAFASVIHDRVYLLNQRFDLFDISVHGDQVLLDALGDGKGVLLIGAHMGSFEVIRALGRHHAGLKVAMAMFEENARKMQEIFAAINPEAQQDVIGLGQIDSMLKIQDALEQGTLVGMLADRTFNDTGTQPVTILGDAASLPVGPFRMAAILKRPVIFMAGLYLGGNRYAIHFEPLGDFSAMAPGQRQAQMQATMARYGQLLEACCRRAPDNWFNFFDFWRQPEIDGKERT